ncbi:hypothetical protein [Christiangramia salexigens]|uniref:Adhesin domain-containing protein n=1 Tax=Christiangramia salexigens TaxID=1913577 RepID=A0A1L3J2P9_9FLAO|nr:hypothetical protein [Christiangramia salexigens]APG59393.1 hypothetical protein LPB144_02755 [Christiangramia salexigens]
MKALLFNLMVFAVLAPGLPYFDVEVPEHKSPNKELSEARHTREKKIKKQFEVASNSNLEIDNSYGNIDITTWEENRVIIEVIIKTSGNDEDRVQDKLDEINVEFNQSGTGVMAKTHFRKENRSWWKELLTGFDNVNMEVNYIIRAPVGNNLKLNNDYGGIYIDKTTGNTRINCDYGKIDIGELRGKTNILDFDYTKNSRIGYVTNIDINADYSGFEILEAETVKINADYTESRVKKASKLEFNCDYGSMEIDKVRSVKGDGDYLSTKINRVFNSLDINLDYGSLSIEKIIKGTKNVNIETDYAGVKIGYDNEMSFDFEVKTSYGNINGLEDLNVKIRNNRSSGDEVAGSYGSGSGARFKISTSYGNVKFYKK